MMRRVSYLSVPLVAGIVLMTLAMLAAVVHAPSALAHAHYDHSTPSIGQVLSTAPTQVDIYTDSDMRKIAGANTITVTGPDGSRVDNGTTVVDDANRQHFSVGLLPNLSNGRYVVSFQTLSDVDGDYDHGRFAFYVGAGPTAEQKTLDAQLNGVVTAAPAPAASGSSSAPLLIAAIAGGAAVLVLLVAGGIVWRKRRAAH